VKKIYLFFLAILLSMQSFGLQYKYDSSAHCTNNTMLFTSEATSSFRQWIYSPSDFAAVSLLGNIVTVYMKASSNPIANVMVKMGAMGLKYIFNSSTLKS